MLTKSPRSHTELADEVVLKKSLHHPAFFALIVERYEKQFLALAMRVVHSREEAEDIVQDTFFKIYRHGPRFKKQQNASFKSWAYKILINTAYSSYRKKKRAPVLLDEFFDTLLYGSAVEAFATGDRQRETHDSIERSLAELPEEIGKLLRMHYFEGKSYQEIVAYTGLSIGAVKARLHKGRKLFKKHFIVSSIAT